MSTTPDRVLTAATADDLGALRSRYAFRPVFQRAILLMLGVLLIPALFVGGAFLYAEGPLVVACTAWLLTTRRNQAVYLFHGGIVRVSWRGSVTHAWPWHEIDRVTSHEVTVQGQLGSVRRKDFWFVGVQPETGFVINNLQMQAVDELALHVERRVRSARLARLEAGQPVRFGVFEVSPQALRHVPIAYRDRPSIPVTIPWRDVIGFTVSAERTIISLSGRADLTESLLHVSDPELFAQALRSRIGRR